MTPSAASLPRSILACAPVLWRGVLFPGTGPGGTRLRLGALLLVVVLPGLLLYPCLSFRLLEPDEGRYAQIPREMLVRGDWVVPHLQGQPYLDKPPLMYWLVMLSYRVFGVHDWAARIPAALAVHGSILATFLFGRRLVGERAALAGALLLSLAPGFTSIGRLLILDGLLACCVTVSLFAAFEAVRGDRLKWGWWLLAAAASGLGLLTKGPVVEVLLAPPLWAWLRLTGRGAKVGWQPVATFLGVVLAVNLPWYVAICVKAPEFARHFFWEHNVVRFLQPFDHIRPVWFYVPVMLAGLLPATLLLPGFARFLLGDRSAEARTPELGFLVLAGGWCVVFFSLSGSKLPTYVLPAYPPLALALGAYAAHRWRSFARWPLVVAGAAFGLMLVSHLVGIPWYAKQRSPMGEPELVARYCGDPNQPVICFPRSCDSVAFYLGRDDLRATRSKDSAGFMQELLQNKRTVVLFTHRHSWESVRYTFPPELRVVEVRTFRRKGDDLLEKAAGDSPWGLCDLAVIERK